MKAKRDALSEWKQRVLEMKYKLYRINDIVFSSTVQTEKTLRQFFRANDYSIAPNGNNEDNYLLYLLVSSQIKDIHLLNEMASFIDYAELNKRKFLSKSKNNVVNHEGLSNALFEVFVDMYLTEKGMHTQSDAQYIDKAGSIRPLDNYFVFDNKEYLVECCRISDLDSSSLMQLSETLMRTLSRTKIHHYQNYIGHIGFKVEKNLSFYVNKARNEIGKMFKDYLKSFELTDGLPTNIPPKFSSPEYDMGIYQYYTGTSHEQELEKNLYKSLITFYVEPKSPESIQGRLTIKGKRFRQEKDINERLLTKVKRKIDQHKDYVGNKIFFIEIDLTLGVNPNNPIFSPITNEQLDTTPYAKIIDENKSMLFVFVFKRATDDGIDREMRLLGDTDHRSLINKFKKHPLLL